MSNTVLRIACLGWGSLIWKPENLPIIGEWKNDGPMLPIEFSRESGGQRITLVICDNVARKNLLDPVRGEEHRSSNISARKPRRNFQQASRDGYRVLRPLDWNAPWPACQRYCGLGCSA
jgi:nitroreductase